MIRFKSLSMGCGVVLALFFLLLIASMGCSGGGSGSSGDASPGGDVTDDTTPPTVPAGLQAAPLSANRVELTWAAASDDVAVAGYGIYRDDLLVDTTAALVYTDSGLSAETEYRYQVLAFDTGGNESARSQAVHTTTLSEGPAIFVDNGTGDDGHDGSEQAPLATIERAVELAAGGTTIFVRAGGTPYRGVCVNTPGISIVGMGGRPTIDRYVVCDGRNALLYSRADDVVFENFDLDATAYAGDRVRALIFSGLPDAVIHRNRATNIHAEGPGFGESGRSLISSSFCYDCVLENSSSHNAEEHGIYWTNHQDGAVIRNNVVSNADGACLQLNSDPETYTPGHPTQDGIMSDNLVENNIFYDCGDGGGGAAINLAGVEDSVFRNNIVYGTRMAGGIANWDDGYSSWGDRGNYAFGCKNNRFLHNTIDCRSCDRHALSFRNGSTGNSFANNIVLTADRDAIAVDAESNHDLTIDTNIYLEEVFFEDTSEDWISLSAWQDATGYDLNSVEATMAALFRDPASNDYFLSETSPARNAGEEMGVETDIEGVERPQGGRPDIGARELAE